MSKEQLFIRLMQSNTLQDRIGHLDIMISIYSYFVMCLDKYSYVSQFDKEFAVTLRMMHSKATSFRKLLDGIECADGGIVVDHTILYTVIRTSYELLCALELIKIIPDTNEKKLIMENVYIAAGLSSRRKLFAKSRVSEYEMELRNEARIIQSCKTNIVSTKLFASLPMSQQKEIMNEIDKGEYQLILDESRKKLHVGWNEIRKYSNIQNDNLSGLYKFFCNMAHPSYLSITQFESAFSEYGQQTLIPTATKTFLSISSVFLLEYIKAYMGMENFYNSIGDEDKSFLEYYAVGLRGKI